MTEYSGTVSIFSIPLLSKYLLMCLRLCSSVRELSKRMTVLGFRLIKTCMYCFSFSIAKTELSAVAGVL